MLFTFFIYISPSTLHPFPMPATIKFAVFLLSVIPPINTLPLNFHDCHLILWVFVVPVIDSYPYGSIISLCIFLFQRHSTSFHHIFFIFQTFLEVPYLFGLFSIFWMYITNHVIVILQIRIFFEFFSRIYLSYLILPSQQIGELS